MNRTRNHIVAGVAFVGVPLCLGWLVVASLIGRRIPR